ncbi:hypothetical protein BDP27DRAFT_1337000 [Rhodocollybia butyracea]|uniref:Polynucleotide adenylyltransferase n=1 Tax=Rhodocollybia butyracea TaxID=206335 RepID=A0A9P5U0S6_9AGAR|nr:hypothetical protein BDP27DRAFT_1337000 [Rhodocollybia butyracea]
MDHPTVSSANLTSNRTAIVLIPPKEFAEKLNQFRLVHDKSAPRWTAHITLHFLLCRQGLSKIEPFSFKLDGVGSFNLTSYETVHLSISADENIQRIWSVIAQALNYTGRPLTPHVTVGQAAYNNPEALASLRQKAQKLLGSVGSLDWPVRSVVFLRKDEQDGGVMKRCHEIYLAGESRTSFELAPSYPTTFYDGTRWKFTEPTTNDASLPTTLSISTYNILHDDLFPISNRLPSIIQTIVSSSSDIICLQEVTDDSLHGLLSSPSITSQFPYSNRHLEVVLENERNILILSRFHFAWSKLDIGSKHKPAFIATFHNSSSSPTRKNFVLAATHLTAGRAGSYLEQKTAEMEALVRHLYEAYPEDDWVLAGDMNWPEYGRVTPADELFNDAGLVFAHGPTFDPSTNPLAAATVRESPDPQRYDRIYVKKESSWDIESTKLFGNGDDLPSDHYGLSVILRSGLDAAEVIGNPTPALPVRHSHAPTLPLTTNLTTAELVDLATSHSWFPSADQDQQMGAVLDTLRSILCPSNDNPAGQSSTNVRIHIEYVGSYALGVHTAASDVDCLAVGNVSASTFWELSRSRLRHNEMARKRGGGVDVRLRRFVKDAIVQSMTLEVGGVKVDLQYCPARSLVEEWINVASLPSDSPLFVLAASSLVTLNAYRDVLALRKLLQPPALLSAFRTAHRALKQFLTTQGLSGGRFGFLGGFHLTLLLTRVTLSLHDSREAESQSELQPHDLVRHFFDTYAKWNWERDAVWAIPSREHELGSIGRGYRRTAKEPIVVLSIERPLSNLTFHASRNSLEVMRKALGRADRMLEEGRSWAEVCGLAEGKDVPYRQFLKEHKAFIKLDVHFWGGSNLKGRALIGWLESRIVSLLVQLSAAAPNVLSRFWPQRFADAGTVEHATDPNGFYLFGLSSLSSSSSSPPTASTQNSKTDTELSALTQCIRTFETELQSNDKFYDASNTFISISIVKRGSLEKDIGLSNIIPDPFTWSDDGFDPLEDEDDDEADSPSESSDSPDAHTKTSQEVSSASQRKKALAASRAAKATAYTPAPGKLRTSADVMNRLLWDPVLGKDDYAVGYEDRFLGIRESMLRDWVMKEVEHESFIPQHRIVYFKRVADGEVLWDRRKKIDLVFGSGLGAGV